MTDYFRVTVEDLSTGEKRSVDVTEGDYVLVPFEPCHLANFARHANGTVQLTIKDHHPAGPAQNDQSEVTS